MEDRLTAQSILAELRADLIHHRAWEGQPVEVRTRSGSWRDVEDYLEEVIALGGLEQRDQDSDKNEET